MKRETKQQGAFLNARRAYRPKSPKSLLDLRMVGFNASASTSGSGSKAVLRLEALKDARPGKDSASALKVGVVLSGGQAPGGHNVICALYQGLKQLSEANQLYGFLGGPSGILSNKSIEITAEICAQFQNTGGFDMIGSGRTKIETDEQFRQCLANLSSQGFKGLVIIGGDDSNTNAALLADFFSKQGSDIRVIGVPKTIDGDLRSEDVEMSFGFDTASKLYSELVANIAVDARSARKYYHFIRLMGRSASHITLETALRTRPNLALISEEVKERGSSLQEVADQIAACVIERAAQGKHYGVILVPEGLIEFIPEMGRLIASLNDILAAAPAKSVEDDSAWLSSVSTKLPADLKAAFNLMPEEIQKQLLSDRDPHGNVQVSKIETEKLLIGAVTQRLALAKSQGRYDGKFAALSHFFGYEGRCAAPTNFDADYTHCLGLTACLLLRDGCSSMIAALKNLSRPVAEWEAGGVPLEKMMVIERRHGKDKAVIAKALVELDSQAFRSFQEMRATWQADDAYLFPGPIQYFGPDVLCEGGPRTMILNHGLQIDA